ncbi:hypothetical protein QQ045_026041 [Rhodiola kirilowii]
MSSGKKVKVATESLGQDGCEIQGEHLTLVKPPPLPGDIILTRPLWRCGQRYGVQRCANGQCIQVLSVNIPYKHVILHATCGVLVKERPESELFGPVESEYATTNWILILPEEFIGNHFGMYAHEPWSNITFSLMASGSLASAQVMITTTNGTLSDSYNLDHVLYAGCLVREHTSSPAFNPPYDTKRYTYTSLENQVTQYIIGSITQQPLLDTTGKNFELKKYLAASLAYNFSISTMDFPPGAYFNINTVHHDQHYLFLEEGMDILVSIKMSPFSHVSNHVAKTKPPTEVHDSITYAKLRAATGLASLESKKNNLAACRTVIVELKKEFEALITYNQTLVRIDSHNKVIFKRTFAWYLLASIFTWRHKLMIFPLSRPPTVNDLEDKVAFERVSNVTDYVVKEYE